MRVKSAFTRARDKLANHLSDTVSTDCPTNREIKDLCEKLASKQEQAFDVMMELSESYRQVEDTQNRTRVITEMEKLESEFSVALEHAEEFWGSQKVCSKTGDKSNSSTRGGRRGSKECGRYTRGIAEYQTTPRGSGARCSNYMKM